MILGRKSHSIKLFAISMVMALVICVAFAKGDLPHPLRKGAKAKLVTEFNHAKRFNRHYPPKKFPFIQFAVKSGTPVFLIAKGEVVETSYMKSYGKNVVINSGDSLLIRYFHLSEILVDSSATIKQGQKIGKTGSSGLVTAPALGIKASVDSIDVDPCKFMDCEAYRRKPTK